MLHHVIQRMAHAMALLGGLVLSLLIVMVCLSVAGRALGDLAHSGTLGGIGAWLIDLGVGPILGDFELVEAGVAFAIFAFLPITQLNGAHAQVDIFTSGLGPQANRSLSAFWSLVMAVIVVLITWRLFEGMQDKIRYNETSYLIQFPTWWAYAASFAAAVAASIVSLYCAAMDCTGRRRS